VTNWRKLTAGTLAAAICLFGLAARADAGPGQNGQGGHGHEWDRKAGDHPKLDRKLNDRADGLGLGMSRVIIILKQGANADNDIRRFGGRGVRKLDIISGQVVELPNYVLRRLADNPAIADIHWDRPAAGEMNYAAITVGARAVQQKLGFDGAGVGVAVIDSGVTAWHDDLTYQGSNPAVKVVSGQRVTKFVDFVNGHTTPYDDNGHGSHVAGIILGNGYDTNGVRAGIAPAADLVSLKVLDAHGGGYISNVIAALDWAVANKAAYNIRVINLSVGAAVTESYNSDPLALAAKRAVDAGIVVVTTAGNFGRSALTGKPQYGAITAPGNAPWVLTVGAYSHNGTVTRTDDTMAPYSSRGPTNVDFDAKPDVVAPGTGIVSLAVQGSTFYNSKPAYLLNGTRSTSYKPYLSLTGTSMAAPMVAGTVALMVQANPKLTPNLIKAIIEYTAEDYGYDALTQGAGFLNAKGAVDLARFYYTAKAGMGQKVPTNRMWSRTIIWGNQKLRKGMIKPQGSAYSLNVTWGASASAEGDNIVWGTVCASDLCDNIVWGTAAMEADNIVWGTVAQPGDSVVWATVRLLNNIVWGTSVGTETDNIVWGTACGGDDCANIVWGTSLGTELDNIVWGTATALEADNIVWGTSGVVADNIVWATSSADVSPIYDDPTAPAVFDGVSFDSLFGTDPSVPAAPVPAPVAPPAVLPVVPTLASPLSTSTPVIGGGL
jgi:serine protease AprX